MAYTNELGTIWLESMKKGDFSSAWDISDQILREGKWRDKSLPRHMQQVWDGTPVDGKRVVVRCYHGLGDTIQFSRYLPKLSQIAKEVTILVQPPLIPLLEHLKDFNGEILPLTDAEQELAYDLDLEIMELPFIFRTTQDDIPNTTPYFNCPTQNMFSNIDNLKVGVVTSCGVWDDRRSVPVSYLHPLFSLKEVSFYSFSLEPEYKITQALDVSTKDINEVATKIKSMDLMITVDTMMAHLSGALGVETWTMLHADPDWRWMKDRTDSPWYPSMKLYRQPNQGDWESVIKTVQQDLSELAKMVYDKRHATAEVV